MTLLEIMLAMTLTSVILAATSMLLSPFLTQYNDALKFQKLRQEVSNSLEAIQNDILSARASYVDSSLCYSLCLIDKTSGNRILYYWSGNDLKRVSGSASSSISCSGGKTVASSFDRTNSLFSQTRELTRLKLAKTGTNSTSYRLETNVLPLNVKKTEPFYDGFGCNSTSGKGWTFTNTSRTYWRVESSSGASGAYWLRQSLTSNQATAQTATAEIAVDLNRLNSAYLQFRYRTQGTMDPGETFKVYFYDGTTWHEVFVDDLLGSISSLSLTTIDLSSYSLNANNRLKFEGNLTKSGDHWVIDEISIISK